MLVKEYPELLKYMLKLVMKEDMPEEQVRRKNSVFSTAFCVHISFPQLVGALKSVMAAHIDVESGLPLLETISMKVQQTGLELLR